jgi:hypothetical protein
MNLVRFGALALLLAGGTATAQTASVALHVVSLSGNLVPYRVAEFTRRSTGRDISSSFQGLNADSVPYGDYRCVLARADIAEKGDFGVISGDISVYQPELTRTFLTVGTIAISGGREGAISIARSGPQLPVMGSVTGLAVSAGPRWVRLQQVYSQFATEAEISRSGEFKLHTALEGQYVVMVLDRGRVVNVESRVFDGTERTLSIAIRETPSPSAQQ